MLTNDKSKNTANYNVSDSVRRNLATALRIAKPLHQPFTHFVVDRFFPRRLFDAIADYLPPTECYLRAERSHRRPASAPWGERTILPLDSAGIERLPESIRSLWEGIVEGLCCEAGWSQLARLCGLEPAQLQAPPGRSRDPVAQAILSRDFPPYAIGPHTDVPDRIISAIVYLSPIGQGQTLGTALFRPRPPRSCCNEGRHYQIDSDEFDVVGVVPFLPNRALLFPRSNRSFHGVLPSSGEEPPRDVLLFELAWRRARE